MFNLVNICSVSLYFSGPNAVDIILLNSNVIIIQVCSSKYLQNGVTLQGIYCFSFAITIPKPAAETQF